jgi:hypothetical protein
MSFRFAAAAGCLAVAFAACRPPAPALVPPPDLRQVQGWARLRLDRAGQAGRSKFFFAIALPSRGQLEIVDPLGRRALQIFIEGEEAYLVVPSKKAYARGSRSDVLGEFLGFPIALDEIVGLLTGRWGDADSAASLGWAVERDGRNRVTGGRREGLSFSVLEFFPGNGVPRRFSFRGGESSGTVVLLEAAFNRPIGPPNRSFQSRFKPLSWDELLSLLRDED